MTNFKTVLFLTIIVAILHRTYGSVTEEQIYSALNMMKSICLPKFKSVKEEETATIKQGVFPDKKDVKCYVDCVLELLGIMKKGKFQLQAALKQTELLIPEPLKESYRNGMHTCKDNVINIKDKCEASYEQLKCLEKNVDHFFFP